MHIPATRRALGVIAFTAAIGIALAGCSAPGDSSSATEFDPDADVTITVGDMPTGDQAESLKSFKAQVAEFEKRFPNIKVVGEETTYDPSSFNALLVGGTAPTTMGIPFTEMTAFVERGQAADITDYIAEDSKLNRLDDAVQTTVLKDDRRYGLVRGVYSMALIYNRGLYEEAGLDPDDVPTDWEGILQNAATIAKKTGEVGFIIPTTGNQGGWMLTTLATSNGSLVQKVEGDTVTTAIDTDAMKDSLQFLHDMRWKQDAAGSNFLLSYDDALNALAGGSIGQTVNAGSIYTDLIFNRGMNMDDLGIAPLPQGSDGLGAIGGGTVEWFNPKATPNQLAAAAKWSEFRYFDRYFDKDAAIEEASSRAADGLPVGLPGLPIFEQSVYDDYYSWIDEYINVDRERFAPYLDTEIAVVPEPSIKTQELYGTLDSVAQAVLTDRSADIDKLVGEAQVAVQAIVDAG